MPRCRGMRYLLLSLALLLAAGCGDNIRPGGPYGGGVGGGNADPCHGTFRDWGGTGEYECDIDVDGDVDLDGDGSGGEDVDGGAGDGTTGTSKSACCVGALKGKVPHECAPPKGTCKFDSICEGVVLYLCTP